MAYRKPLFEVTYHYDDDTGMHEIGEIDTGLGEELLVFARQYDIDELNYYLETVLPRRIIDFVKYDKEKNPDKYKK